MSNRRNTGYTGRIALPRDPRSIALSAQLAADARARAAEKAEADRRAAAQRAAPARSAAVRPRVPRVAPNAPRTAQTPPPAAPSRQAAAQPLEHRYTGVHVERRADGSTAYRISF